MKSLQKLNLENDEICKSIKKLPISFIGRGEVKRFTFTQIKLSNKAYIYEVCDTFGNKWYEIFKKIIDTRFDKIAYPKSKAFGISAWTAKTFEAAVERMEVLSSAVNHIAQIDGHTL